MKEIYKSKTNIVMTCWNALDHTKVTLQSMFETVHHPYFLTIVDNGSRDGTGEFLKNLEVLPWCEKLILITNEVNKGIIDANNQGQIVSNKYGLEYTCICNNDLYFQDNWLSILEKHIGDDPGIGIIGTLRPAVDVVHHIRPESSKAVVDGTPKGYSITEELKYFQGPHTFAEATEMLIIKNGGGVSILRCPPNAVVTCCALVRNSVSEKIGLFSDTCFEIYGSEDIDLSWRLQKAGYVCAIAKDVYVHHFRHRSIIASNLDRDRYLRENNMKFYEKWKHDLFAFLRNEEKMGVDIRRNLSSEENHEYFFLRRIRENIDFMLEYEMNNVITEKVAISNPIGNLYRKRHVLVLVVNKESNFILGKKRGFYPDHIARMLGGGIEENEDPKIAAKREIEEELLVNIPVESFNELCSVVTQASTSEGEMEMQTWVYSVRLPDSTHLKPSDDITGIQVFTLEQYENLVKDITYLSGEFVTDKFSFLWADWGKIYGPIHKYALERFREIRNQ